VKLSEINALLNGELIGNPDLCIDGANDIKLANDKDITFILEKKYEKDALSSQAKAFVTYKKCEVAHQIIVNDPRKALAQVLDIFFKGKPALSASSTAIHPSVNTQNLQLGPHVCIGENTTIGAGSNLYANVVIGANCSLGEGCVLYPNVTIYDNSKIGKNVIIQANSSIGSTGFGYYMENGTWKAVPQVGHIIIEDNVDIGANCSLDRGCLGATLIKTGSKLDNLIHLAHNSSIGESSAITAQVGTTGGAIIGNRVMIGGQTGVASVKIGDNTIVASRSGVTRDIPSGSFVSGFPAWEHKKELLKEAWLRKSFKKKRGDS
jgi:UDP-3-O-[3-hydroxymyristoyl] glucosamine N-acyltransferase